MDLQDVLQRNLEFQYGLLARLKMDCDYFLGGGGRHPKHLWANSVEEQIDYMFSIWASLNEKPEWLTKEQLDGYKVALLN